MRFFNSLMLILFLFLIFYIYTESKAPIDNNNVTNTTTTDNQTQPEISDTLSVLSWNLQIYGQDKSQNIPVVERIVSTITGYDLITLQEIRDVEETSHLAITSRMPSNYDYVLSPRTGRTDSKEAYLIIYNKNKLTKENSEFIADEGDLFERDLYQVNFGFNNKSIVLVSTHIKPDDAVIEINTMMDIVPNRYDNYIIAGDYNAACDYFSPNMYNYTLTWVPHNDEDTTTGQSNCAYDRIATKYEISSYGVLQGNLQNISDHYPIYAKLKI